MKIARDVDLLLMHNQTFAAEYATLFPLPEIAAMLTHNLGSRTPSQHESASTSLPRRSSWV
jgi:hypothetical protein